MTEVVRGLVSALKAF